MKKVILLSVSFLVITLFLSLPAFADTSWSYTSTSGAKGLLKDALGNPMKLTATLTYDVLDSGAQPVKYSVDALVFHLSDDASSFVDTDITISGTVIEPKGGTGPDFNLTGGMQGGALPVPTVNTHTYTVTVSYSAASETAHPFSFTDAQDVMTGDGLMTSTAEGTLIESFKNGIDQSKAKINMTFKFVGKLDTSNEPALITVTLSGIVSKP